MGVKEYELPDGRKAVFEFDENGVGKITLEAMDLLMGLIKADLIRCGECKWCDNKGKGRALICTNPYIDMDIHPLDFCSYGERRADGDI